MASFELMVAIKYLLTMIFLYLINKTTYFRLHLTD